MTAERVFVQHLLHLERQRRKASAHIRVACREPHSHIPRYSNHRRPSTSRTRASASGSTCASTRMHRRLPRSISINPVRAAAAERTRPSTVGKSFGASSAEAATAAICTGVKDGITCFRCSCLSTPGKHQAGRYSVATRNLSHLRARRQRLLDNPCLVVLRPAPPPLQPAQNLDPHRLMTLKLDLRSHASRITIRHARRPPSDAYGVSNVRSAELVGVAQPVARCGEVGGIGRRRQVAQRRMRALAVVVGGPSGNSGPGVIEA
ncbi:hypothetical protein ACVWW5_007147 [Bradyrhizobium sp. LM3.4]